MTTARWELALGGGKRPSDDQRAAITAPLAGRRCIDAGAGTGKTATLALRALYLIETRQILAHELLVVTFTRKAAAEIGQRIHNMLPASGDAGTGGSVTCSTIHALAASLLREFAYDCGLGDLPRTVTDGEARAIFHRSFAAMLRGELTADASALPLPDLLSGGYDFEGDLACIALTFKNRGTGVDEFERGALARSDVLERQDWGQLWKRDGRYKREVRRAAEEPNPERTAGHRIAEAEAERKNVRLVAALFRRFDEDLRNAGAMTYGDLIASATAMLLSHPEIVTVLRERWKYALIDEFQDTSLCQMRFLTALFGDGPLMPVGDFRQSIYGFNGAHPRVMQEFKEMANRTYPLTVNRRSYREIVQSAHAVLRARAPGLLDALDAGLDANKREGGADVVRVQTFRSEGGVREHAREEALGIAGEIERLLRGGVKASQIAILLRRRTHAQAYVRELNARGIAAALDRRTGLLDAAEVRDAMAWMALLLRLDNTRAAVRILQSPAVGISDGGLAAIAGAPGARNAAWLRPLLRGELDAQLDPDTAARVRYFRSLLEGLLHAPSLPLAQGVREVLRLAPIAASYATPPSLAAAQVIANLRNLQTLAESHAAERPIARLADFVTYLEDFVKYGDEPQEAELDFDGVRIMTVHQAKGLEWDYVFVACVSDDQYSSVDFGRGRTVRVDPQSYALALRFSLDGTTPLRWYMSDAPHDPQTGMRSEEDPGRREREDEQARIFYVAMTRAKERLYISGIPSKGKKEPQFLETVRQWALERDIAPERLHFAAEPGHAAEASSAAMRAPIGVTQDCGTVAYEAQSVFVPRMSFTAIATFQTCPRQARYRYRLYLPDLREGEAPYAGAVESAAATIDATTFGNIVHRAMELWGRAAIDGAPVEEKAAFAQAIAEFAEVPESERRRALAAVRSAIDALAGYVPIEVEAPFTTIIEGIRIEGYIDLVARERNGAIAIIDYKTGRTEDEHYALQLAVYKHAYEESHPGAMVLPSILRVSGDGARFRSGREVSAEELGRSIREAGALRDDTPRVGEWCRSCAYAGGPCDAFAEHATVDG